MLRLLKEGAGLTFRQLENRAGRAGRRLPRSTIASALTRPTLPREEFTEALVSACGLDARPWLAAHRRLAYARPPQPTTAAAAHTTPLRPLVVPRQLPFCRPDLTGHEHRLADLIALLTDPRSPAPSAVISGPPGSGKSALAARAAHRVAAHYPDGQLYVQLRGTTPHAEPLTAAETIARLLRGLAIPVPAPPHDASETAALLRSALTGRRVLILLDDAASAAQVRPLLPTGGHSALLVTARSGLTSLDGPRSFPLGTLLPGEAYTVLEQLLGSERVARDPSAAFRLAELCGWLPLGLRVAAARLTARPRWPLSLLVDRLTDESTRLDELRVDELQVRESLAVSYRALRHTDGASGTAVRAFLLFGSMRLRETGIPLLSELLCVPLAEAERAAERLVDTSLAESTGPGRYRMHDLVRIYAGEQAAQELLAQARAIRPQTPAVEQQQRPVRRDHGSAVGRR
ncbi:AAA family ATPase [Streptomyces sp. NPDC048257]|uniref:AAA family ATPase n=1 Tax=Streptomyces sp. NPDC048257 TaxID=3365526 RepID=UPI00371769CD